MSHKKPKDNRSDCIFRYKDSLGQLVCSNDGYRTSDEYIRIFGVSKYFTGNVYNNKLVHSGGFILSGDAPITHCRRCKYYCNNIKEYIAKINKIKTGA